MENQVNRKNNPEWKDLSVDIFNYRRSCYGLTKLTLSATARRMTFTNILIYFFALS